MRGGGVTINVIYSHFKVGGGQGVILIIDFKGLLTLFFIGENNF